MPGQPGGEIPGRSPRLFDRGQLVGGSPQRVTITRENIIIRRRSSDLSEPGIRLTPLTGEILRTGPQGGKGLSGSGRILRHILIEGIRSGTANRGRASRGDRLLESGHPRFKIGSGRSDSWLRRLPRRNEDWCLRKKFRRRRRRRHLTPKSRRPRLLLPNIRLDEGCFPGKRHVKGLQTFAFSDEIGEPAPGENAGDRRLGLLQAPLNRTPLLEERRSPARLVRLQGTVASSEIDFEPCGQNIAGGAAIGMANAEMENRGPLFRLRTQRTGKPIQGPTLKQDLRLRIGSEHLGGETRIQTPDADSFLERRNDALRQGQIPLSVDKIFLRNDRAGAPHAHEQIISPTRLGRDEQRDRGDIRRRGRHNDRCRDHEWRHKKKQNQPLGAPKLKQDFKADSPSPKVCEGLLHA